MVGFSADGSPAVDSRPANFRRNRRIRFVMVGLCLVAVRPWIEFWYSTTVYPRIQRTLTPFSNLVPFAILDLLLLIVVPTVIFRLVAAGRESWRVRGVRPLGRTVFHLLATTAALYIAFLALWGFNYRRVRMPCNAHARPNGATAHTSDIAYQ